MPLEDLIPLISALVISAFFGAIILWISQRIKLTHFKHLAAELISKAEAEAEAKKKSTEIALRHQQIEQQREFEQYWQLERRKIQHEEERLKHREDKIESRMSLVEKKLLDIEKREAILIARKAQVTAKKRNKRPIPRHNCLNNSNNPPG